VTIPTDSCVLAKLVLLQQGACDPRLDGSAKGVLAVVLDACWREARCFIGPTAIANIVGINERTARRALESLQKAGYLAGQKRNARSSWWQPNFVFAEKTGCLVTRHPDGSTTLNRPENSGHTDPLEADFQVRVDDEVRGEPGLRVRHSGHAAQEKRTRGPGLAGLDVQRNRSVKKTVSKTITNAHERALDDLFNEFWKAYPRKVARGAAWKAFAKRKPDRAMLAKFLAAIEEQRRSEGWQRDGGRYIPHPATWLNDERWADELPRVVNAADRFKLPREQDPDAINAATARRLGIKS